MAQLSYTFKYLPVEDRVALVLKSENKDLPSLLFTRRMTRHLSETLRKYAESKTELPHSVSQENYPDIFEFEHGAYLEQAPITTANKDSAHKNKGPEEIVLPTKIDIKKQADSLHLLFYEQNTFLVKVNLDLGQIHYFLHALGEMSKKAEWGLDEEFGWVLRKNVPPTGSDGTGHYIS